MEISNNKMVTLSYELKENDNQGELIEITSDSEPLEFVYGVGSMLPKFEEQLSGLKMNENFEMYLDPEDAYGLVDNNAIVDLSKDIFMENGNFDNNRFFVGNMIPMRTQQGQNIMGRILEVKDQFLTMDFNHPLAGRKLYFTGKVLDVRETTEDELKSFQGCGCGTDHNCDCD